jgi:DtxR family Mn-dependent transcriptional regulator
VEDNSELLRYLAELGLMPGTLVRVLEIAPFDGPMTIDIDGVSKVIGFPVAQEVLVTAQKKRK